MLRIAPILGAGLNRKTKVLLGASAPCNTFVLRNVPNCLGDGWDKKHKIGDFKKIVRNRNCFYS
jgi:hypothetical protein